MKKRCLIGFPGTEKSLCLKMGVVSSQTIKIHFLVFDVFTHGSVEDQSLDLTRSLTVEETLWCPSVVILRRNRFSCFHLTLADCAKYKSRSRIDPQKQNFVSVSNCLHVGASVRLSEGEDCDVECLVCVKGVGTQETRHIVLVPDVCAHVQIQVFVSVLVSVSVSEKGWVSVLVSVKV